jgi:hypothetical protein
MNIKRFVAEDVGRRKECFLAELKKIRLAQTRSGTDITFKVYISSAWEGESSVEGFGKTLPSAMKAAETDFMNRNRRSDVQGQYTVWACTSGLSISLPEKFWMKYRQK